jgi:hypothetical protein
MIYAAAARYLQTEPDFLNQSSEQVVDCLWASCAGDFSVRS